MSTLRYSGIRRCLGFVVLAMTLASCHRIQPIYDVPGHPIPAASSALSATRITDLIVKIAEADGWLVERIGPADVRATEKWRDHAAVVRISTDGKTFSIRNEGSTNLLQANGNIHKAYNERVKKLENAIERRLYANP